MMNIKKYAIFVFLYNCSVVGMELPEPVDHKKLDSDEHILMTALESIDSYHGNTQFTIGSSAERNDLLYRFKTTWKKESLAPLGYNFDSYMKRAGIDNAWLEEWYKNRPITNNHVIMLKEFTELIRGRFTKHLSNYKS